MSPSVDFGVVGVGCVRGWGVSVCAVREGGGVGGCVDVCVGMKE